jgi:hypothetical protein
MHLKLSENVRKLASVNGQLYLSRIHVQIVRVLYSTTYVLIYIMYVLICTLFKFIELECCFLFDSELCRLFVIVKTANFY